MTSDRRLLMLIIVGLIAILTTLGTKWFFNNFEYKEIEEFTGHSAEARRNKFLAAEYYLRDLGFKVESDSNRTRLLEPHTPNQTILINNYGPKLSPTRFNELIQWLESGGHLIYTVNNFKYVNDEGEDSYFDDDYKNDQLLEEYGIQAHYTNFQDDKPYPYEKEELKYVLKDDTEININFSPDTQLVDTNHLANYSLSDEYGAHLLHYEIGNGNLTVLSDNIFLSNDNIGKHDHAYLLWLLSNVNKLPNNNVLLLYNTQSDSIFTLIWENARQACIAFLILVILWLWSMHNRLGPILTLSNYSKRNIVEHLRAIARFSWRQDKGIHLLNQTRMSCENALLIRYPALKSMSIQERIQHLANVLDILPKEIHQALYFEPKSTNEYINSTYYLQKLWVSQ